MCMWVRYIIFDEHIHFSFIRGRVRIYHSFNIIYIKFCGIQSFFPPTINCKYWLWSIVKSSALPTMVCTDERDFMVDLVFDCSGRRDLLINYFIR